MFDWTPEHRVAVPKTDDELARKKADYTSKYGYRINLPEIDDVFDFSWVPSPTDEEERQWRRKGHGDLSDERISEIEYVKRKRKEAYLAWIADPTPELLQSRASLINAIDDLQDGTFTGAALSAMASVATSGATKAALTKLSGWGFGAAALFDVVTGLLSPLSSRRKTKRKVDGTTKENPWTKKGRLRTVDKFVKGGMWPSFILQGLQTTRELFGVGLCLGPVISMPEKIASGAYRYMSGNPVTVRFPGGYSKTFIKDTAQSAEALALLNQFMHHTDDDFLNRLWLQASMTFQSAEAMFDVWNPFDEVPYMNYVYCEAQGVKSVLSREILEEVDPDALDKIAWPFNGQRVNNLMSMCERSREIATANFTNWCDRQKNSLVGMTVAFNASIGSQYAAEAFGGRGSVQGDYTAWTKAYHTMLEFGYWIPEDLAPDKLDCFIRWLEDHESQNTAPSIAEIVAFCRDVCGFELTKQ